VYCGGAAVSVICGRLVIRRNCHKANNQYQAKKDRGTEKYVFIFIHCFYQNYCHKYMSSFSALTTKKQGNIYILGPQSRDLAKAKNIESILENKPPSCPC